MWPSCINTRFTTKPIVATTNLIIAMRLPMAHTIRQLRYSAGSPLRLLHQFPVDWFRPGGRTQNTV